MRSPAHLPKIIDGITHFNFFLEHHHGGPSKDFSLEVHRLLGEFPARRPDSDAGPRGDGNLVADNTVTITSTPDNKFGFTIRNTSMFDLFPYLFYFDPEEYTINLWYGPEAPQVAAPLKAKTQQLHGEVTIGMGSEPGFGFELPDNQKSGSGFFKLFVATEYLEMDWIQQKISPLDPTFEGAPRGLKMVREKLKYIPRWDALTVALTITRG
ncbi:hypothetical protein DFH07DRAFT_747791 [Mycena maculata]|uniref:Uncharacterized protein n=1 Tax=Mycena maculata TaxID=230809 RepID=A0AAD7IP12_9AGAR|nr:hypothetical protein DFH07DRAFT_747791 [Mycena maculata]